MNGRFYRAVRKERSHTVGHLPRGKGLARMGLYQRLKVMVTALARCYSISRAIADDPA